MTFLAMTKMECHCSKPKPWQFHTCPPPPRLLRGSAPRKDERVGASQRRRGSVIAGLFFYITAVLFPHVIARSPRRPWQSRWWGIPRDCFDPLLYFPPPPRLLRRYPFASLRASAHPRKDKVEHSWRVIRRVPSLTFGTSLSSSIALVIHYLPLAIFEKILLLGYKYRVFVNFNRERLEFG